MEAGHRPRDGQPQKAWWAGAGGQQAGAVEQPGACGLHRGGGCAKQGLGHRRHAGDSSRVPGTQCPATLVGWMWFLSHTKESDLGRKSIILFYNILFLPSFPCPSLQRFNSFVWFLDGHYSSPWDCQSQEGRTPPVPFTPVVLGQPCWAVEGAQFM